jgi:NADH-quinone oxidoreductase subunit N
MSLTGTTLGVPTAGLAAIGVLVLGAIVVLLLIGMISPRPGLGAGIGVLFAVVAAAIGLQAPAPFGLAIAGIAAVGAVALLLLPALEPEVPVHVAEAAALLLLGSAGAIALACASDLLQAVVGLETLALSAVTLVALSAGDRPLEAAFKYFVLGAVSLGGLLFGVGLVYLATGSFAFPTAAALGSNPLALAGVSLVALGFAFEMAIFPFNWGGLDAYTAAAPSLAGYVMSASKLAAAYAFGRLAVSVGQPVTTIALWIGCLTIIWGTFGALAQSGDVRRMLGYSAVTHAGFIAVAIGSGSATVAAFYALVYGSMAMLVFASLATVRGGDLTGLGTWRSGALALGLFSLSGIPPAPGFWAKLAVLVVAWQAAGALPTIIVAAGGVFSVLYYLRPMPDVLAGFRAPGAAATQRAMPGLVVAGVAVIVFSVAPGIVWSLAAGF